MIRYLRLLPVSLRNVIVPWGFCSAIQLSVDPGVVKQWRKAVMLTSIARVKGTNDEEGGDSIRLGGGQATNDSDRGAETHAIPPRERKLRL